MGTSDLDRSTVETAYARWAPIYDVVCGPVMVLVCFERVPAAA